MIIYCKEKWDRLKWIYHATLLWKELVMPILSHFMRYAQIDSRNVKIWTISGKRDPKLSWSNCVHHSRVRHLSMCLITGQSEPIYAATHISRNKAYGIPRGGNFRQVTRVYTCILVSVRTCVHTRAHTRVRRRCNHLLIAVPRRETMTIRESGLFTRLR